MKKSVFLHTIQRVAILTLFFSLFCAKSWSVQDTLRPQETAYRADGEWDASGEMKQFEAIDEETPNNDEDYIWEDEERSKQYIWFPFDWNGSGVIDSVKMFWVAKGGEGDPLIIGRAYNDHDAFVWCGIPDTISLTKDYAVYSKSWEADPCSDHPWESQMLNDDLHGFAIESYSLPGGEARATQSYIIVYSTNPDSFPPDTVTGVDTTAVNPNSVSLVCDKSDSADCGGYMVRFAIGSTAPATYNSGTFGDSTSSIDDTTFTISGLLKNTQYSFAIFARDEVPNWTVKGSRSWVTVTTDNLSNYVYYIRKSGSDDSAGTSPSKAWKTISKAVGTMIGGDTVWIGAGDYSTETLTVTDKDYGAWTCFFGDYDGSKTGDAGEVKIHSLCANTDWGRVHIDHLHAVHLNTCGSAYDASVGFFDDPDGRAKVTHCIIDTATANYKAAYFEFTNNFVKSSGGKGFWSAARFCEIDTCYIYNNTMGDSNNWSGGMVLYLDGNSTDHYWVRNNLFYYLKGADDWYIGLEHYGTAHYEAINYNYFDTSYTNRLCAFNRSSWYYCTNIGVWRDSTTFDAQSDTGNPGLDTDKYHLLSSSPCIDAGTSNVSTLVTDDIDGDSRPSNNGYDIGCDENSFVVSLSISVSPTTWNLATLNPSQTKTMTTSEKIKVKNTGNVTEQLSLKIDTMDTKGEWNCSNSESGQAQNVYVMSGIFRHKSSDSTVSAGNFNTGTSDDVIDTLIDWASGNTFAVGTQDTAGANVAVSDTAVLWLQMKMPTTAAGPKADSSRNIIIQIGCQQTP